MEGPPGPGGSGAVPSLRLTATSILFTASGTTLVLPLQPGDVFWEARLVVTQAFDDPSAQVLLGSSGEPSLLFSPSEVDLSQVSSQFDNNAVWVVQSFDSINLTLIPGSSTQGALSVFISYWR